MNRETSPSRPLAGLALALAAAFLWGSNSVIIRRLAMDGVSPSAIAFLRVSLGGLILLALLKGVWRIPWREAAAVCRDRWLAAAVLFYAANMFVFHWALRHSGAATVMVLENIAPVVALLGGWWLFRERVSAGSLAAMALAGLGVWLVARAAPAGGEAGGPSWEGYGLALVAGVTWGAFTLACQGLRPAAPGRVAGGLVTMSAVMLGTALLLLPALGWNPAWPRTAAQWGWCGVLAVVHTALANVLWRLALEHIGAFAASLVFLLTIVFTMVNGALFLDEPVTWPLGLGAAAIVSAVFVGRSRATATSRAPDCAAATRGPPPR